MPHRIWLRGPYKKRQNLPNNQADKCGAHSAKNRADESEAFEREVDSEAGEQSTRYYAPETRKDMPGG